jgi:hypothetical protein
MAANYYDNPSAKLTSGVLVQTGKQLLHRCFINCLKKQVMLAEIIYCKNNG